ncbi:MAG: hypothetical protein ACPGMR_06895 [Pontibacterium sp.]
MKTQRLGPRLLALSSFTLTLLLISPSTWAKSPFLLGVGGYELCQHSQGVSIFPPACNGQRIPMRQALDSHLPQANSVTLWITRDWQADWYDPAVIQTEYINKDIEPVFLFYWFADDISPEFVTANTDAYRKDLTRFLRYLEGIPGPKKVIFDPEFNQQGIESWPEYNDFLIENMRRAKAVKDTQVSFCVGDFGVYSTVNDTHNFSTFDTSIRRAAKVADFISFQEMRAITRNSDSDIRLTPERTLAFARHLHQTYQKPTYLTYLAISSMGPNGLARQGEVFQGFADRLSRFQNEAGLIGFSAFHYTDIPHHQGYFGDAEAFFGVVDKNGHPKPALKGLQNIAKAAGLSSTH